MPRQSPQIPPKLEMKSSQVIFGDLSNSERKVRLQGELDHPELLHSINQSVKCLPNAVESPKKRLTTAMSFSQALYIWSPFKRKCSIMGVFENMPSERLVHLCNRREKFLSSFVWWILRSHWSLKLTDVASAVVPCIGFVDIWLPFH